MRVPNLVVFGLAVALAGLAWPLFSAKSEPAVQIDPPKLDATAPKAGGLQTAVIAGGCFWGVQAVYQHTKGVKNAVSGYAGGGPKDATYETVSGGNTTHAEAVQVTFDPHEITYGQILQIFFSVAHNPTELNRQGPDVGAQYRSEIFPQNDEQARIARAYIAQLDEARSFKRRIATKVSAPKAAFYRAEAYHQDYALNHPNQPYIVVNDAPKVENLRRMFPTMFRDAPVTVASVEKKG
jgi:peptide-methionine (S)-S-oxide reductase